MFIDANYALLSMFIAGAFCGLCGLAGENCAVTRRAVLAAALQGGLLFITAVETLRTFLGPAFGMFIYVAAIPVAMTRMAFIVPIVNFLLKLMYDVLFHLIKRIIK